MTIKKSFDLQIDYEDGSLDHVTRKGTTAAEVLKAAEAEFPDAYYVSVTGRTKDAKWDRTWKELNDRPLFRSGSRRFGQYTYRHKGRKVRGRKNYQGRGYQKRPDPWFVWTETYSQKVAEGLKTWVNFLTSAIDSTLSGIEHAQT